MNIDFCMHVIIQITMHTLPGNLHVELHFLCHYNQVIHQDNATDKLHDLDLMSKVGFQWQFTHQQLTWYNCLTVVLCCSTLKLLASISLFQLLGFVLSLQLRQARSGLPAHWTANKLGLRCCITDLQLWRWFGIFLPPSGPQLLNAALNVLLV